MPSSPFQQLTQIVELIRLTDPQNLLDIGVGFGKYGVLSREYLEINSGNLDRNSWQRRIDGIEGFQSYLNPLHEYVYDHVYVGDAAQLVPTLPYRYDLALVIDILEHFDYTSGCKLIVDLRKISRNVLVGTPKEWVDQGAIFGNRMEEHKFRWERKHFGDFGAHCFIPNEFSLICFIGEDAPMIEQRVLSLKRGIKRNFPYLLPMKRRIERYLSNTRQAHPVDSDH
ncbi:MAG: hypothetical protein KDI55_10610 [Anaerolineae bacterium]|nr:hypothetical protein [Anaerolineae bacterium]